jgi:site-specific DNA-methyltransferase (adenine-specific)
MKPYYDKSGIRIYCGDAREIVAGLGLFDFIFTDPPYGHNNNNGDLIHCREEALGVGQRGKARPIANDDPKNAHELADWLFATAARQLRCCCCCCCCGGGGPDPQFARWSLMMDRHIRFKQMIVWDKGPMGMGWHYRRSTETVLVGQKGNGKCKWYDRSHRVENVIRPGDYGIRKIIPKKGDHPNVKPVALGAHFMRLHTKPGDIVLDPFMGSGSTLVAARQLGRRAVGVELSKRWCRKAAERLEVTTFAE